MFITASNLAHYLVSRSLITTNSVVDGDFAVIEAGRRNRNFKVERGRAPGLFVKQPQTTTPEALLTLNREAAFYGLLRGRPAFEPLARVAPRFIDYNPSTVTLVIELVSDGENLTEYHLRREGFPEDVAALLGQGLGAYHASAARILSEPVDRAILPRQAPWVFSLAPRAPFPLEQFGHVGERMTALLQLFPGLFERATAVGREWRIDSVIHGDMKWDNFVISVGDDAPRGLRIVDWEMADFGDASWDVASVFIGYLLYWLWSSAQRQPAQAEELAEVSRARLEQMRPALRAFWRAYSDTRQFTAATEREYLKRCIRFCPARIMLAAFEHLFNVPQITTHLLAMMTVGESICQNPDQALTDLLGAGAGAKS